jgi:hypothetical protein
MLEFQLSRDLPALRPRDVERKENEVLSELRNDGPLLQKTDNGRRRGIVLRIDKEEERPVKIAGIAEGVGDGTGMAIKRELIWRNASLMELPAVHSVGGGATHKPVKEARKEVAQRKGRLDDQLLTIHGSGRHKAKI